MPPHQSFTLALPPPILRLPGNIIERITENLDTTSVSHLYQTCHHMRSITARSLYNTVELRPDRSMSFTISITNNFQLRKLVESLSVHDHHTIDTIYAESLGLVIPQLRNLKHLTIKGCYTSTHGQFLGEQMPQWTTLYLPPLQPTALTKLESCNLSLSSVDSYDLSDRSIIFHHPTLRHLAILGCTLSNLPLYTDDLVHSTPLQTLALLCADISAATLRKIVSLPRALTRFTMAGKRQLEKAEFTDTKHDLYIQALEVQKASLVNIELGLWNFKYEHCASFDLSEFAALESFTITPLVLPPNYKATKQDETVNGPRRSQFHNLTRLAPIPFPASLRDLTFFHIEHSTFKHVERVVLTQLAQLVSAEKLPNLRCITFATPISSGEYEQADLDLPHGWENAFMGRVKVVRLAVHVMKQFPVRCACCDYKLGGWVVE
ncbi:hypothetical protein BJY04DRAFT_213576 [Aspergillus karnatakaensis]|uniref:uncharacterized protein n=1 Tax=Aspergillus karnatakaensis TaxID=1810916 RepID=UPI003CCD79C3